MCLKRLRKGGDIANLYLARSHRYVIVSVTESSVIDLVYYRSLGANLCNIAEREDFNQLSTMILLSVKFIKMLFVYLAITLVRYIGEIYFNALYDIRMILY